MSNKVGEKMDIIISKEINCLSTKIKREISNFDSISGLDNVSGVNSFITIFIYNNRDKNIYQKDIEQEFGITRSTASNIISLMEKKELLKRIAVDDDLRLKKLILTDKAINIAKVFINDLDKLNTDLCEGINNDELLSFINTLNKIDNNLKRRKNNDKSIDEKH